jgi:agmatinase
MSRHAAIDLAFTGPMRGPGSPEPTFSGALSFMRRRYSKDVAGADLVIWGVPFDCAVTMRPGCRFGPAAIRAASAQFCGDPQYPAMVDPFERLAAVDYGDCVIDHSLPMQAHAAIEREAEAILAHGGQLLTLGGDHSITLPLLRAHARRHGPVALVQFDSHQDTWHDDPAVISHGNFAALAAAEGLIDTARSIQIGIRTVAPQDCGIRILHAYDCALMGLSGVVAAIRAHVGEGPAYLSFDIDALDPAYAPGTGTPVAGGFSSREALMILNGILELDFVGMDVVEVSPPYDHAEITAIAASTVAQHYIGALARRRWDQP